jgi:PPM family protein phosphatase
LIIENNKDSYSFLRKIKCVARTDRGLRRSENQDSFGIIERDKYRFYMVADGMGGAKGGAIASDLAISTITKSLSSISNLTVDEVKDALAKANTKIFNEGEKSAVNYGMGTTLCGMGLTDEGVIICNVGDSRIYRYRSGVLKCLTVDHTLVAELKAEGFSLDDSREVSNIAHILTRSLGPSQFVDIDVWKEDQAQTGDIYLLCSDGLYSMVPEETISEVIRSSRLEDATMQLIDLANEKGGIDNITIVMLIVGSTTMNSNVLDSQSQQLIDTAIIQHTGLEKYDQVSHFVEPGMKSPQRVRMYSMEMSPINFYENRYDQQKRHPIPPLLFALFAFSIGLLVGKAKTDLQKIVVPEKVINDIRIPVENIDNKLISNKTTLLPINSNSIKDKQIIKVDNSLIEKLSWLYKLKIILRKTESEEVVNHLRTRYKRPLLFLKEKESVRQFLVDEIKVILKKLNVST